MCESRRCIRRINLLVLLLTPTPEDSVPIIDDEASDGDTPEKEDIDTLEESLISFRLSGPNERLSRNDQSNEESDSSGDSSVHSP